MCESFGKLRYMPPPHFIETIDYIWFASPEFHCKEFIPPYTTPPNQYMPNEKQPSDHFPLVGIME